MRKLSYNSATMGGRTNIGDTAIRPRIGSYVLVSVILVAVVLRVVGLNWGLPHTYEEATPLRKAIDMLGWQRGGPLTLNPGFFNYPSFTFYIHLAMQAAVFLLLKLLGTITTVQDWYVLFLTNPTSQFIAARCVGVAFGALTVWLTYRLARSSMAFYASVGAALLLATNPYHVVRSQMIEVDIPVTCFVVMGLVAMGEIARHGKRGSYLLAGIATGLATSTKYVGITLLGPLIVSHLFVVLGLKAHNEKPWRSLLLSVVLAAVCFAATSPYVLMDRSKALADMASEHEHMLLGHFGSESASSGSFYGHALLDVAGPAVLGLSGLGAIALARRRDRGFWTVMSFMAIYCGTVMTWSLKAERYLLPIVPLVIVLGAAGAETLAGWMARLGSGARRPGPVFAAMGIVLVFLNLAGLNRARETNQNDARTEALEWIENNLPAGALLLVESQGPELLDPGFINQLDPTIKARVLDKWKDRPVFGVVTLPMYQTHPERSAPFYHIDIYRDADYVVTTRAVRGRYAKEPSRFADQVTFYQDLDTRAALVKEVRDRDGAALQIYRLTTAGLPFGKRETVFPPPVISRGVDQGTGREAGFYFSLGANYDYFHHWSEAASCYRRALEYRTSDKGLFAQCLIGYTHCLVALGRSDEAMNDLQQLYRAIDDPQLKKLIEQLASKVASTRR